MKKLTLLLLCFVLAGVQLLSAQNMAITGTVTSKDDGSPIPGASIVVKGTTIGTVTDFEGKYSLNVPQNTASLIFSFVGMSTIEVPINGRSTIDVQMESEIIGMNEVVVTAMGIKRKPKEMGVATAQVDNQELTAAGPSNMMNGLSGKVSGLQINTINNGVNPDTKITLRGNRHFLASNQALVVLDGVPVAATYLTSVNPNDIESVNILKGASAAALYGNDASNGVVIVTTKKGDKGKLKVNISNVTTFERISYMPNLQERFGAGSGESVDGGNYTVWLGPDRNTDPYTSFENQSYGPEFNGQMVMLGGKLVDGTYQMIPYSAIKNQKRDFFDTGISTQNDISVSNGDENGSFYLSAQDVNTTSVIPGDKNRRTSSRFSGSRTRGIFSADYNMSFVQTNTNTSGGDFNQGRPVYWNVLNTPAEVPLSTYKDIDTNPFATLDGYFNAYYPNPYWQIKHSRNDQKRNDLFGSLTLALKPLKWLEFSNRSGVTYNTFLNHNHQDEANFNSYSGTDPWNAGSTAATATHYAGWSSDQMRRTMILTNDVLATIDHTFNDLLVRIIGGSSLYFQSYDSQYEYAGGLVIPDFYNVSNRTGEAQVSQSTLKRGSVGLFGDVTLGYKSYAFLHFSGRNDWDSRLTKENRSFFYPSADASIILSQMLPALMDNPVVSFLKIRGGWSRTGQIALDNWYGTLPSFPAAAGFPYGGTSGFLLSTTLSNPLLKPEQTSEYEIGTEMSFMRNKFHLEVNAYKSNTKDQTLPANISAASGFYSALINAGELENKGLEIDFKVTPIVSVGNFFWNAGINYSFIKSKVISILPGLDEIAISDGSNSSVSFATVGEEFPAIKVNDVLRDPQGHIIVDKTTGLPTLNPAISQVGHGNPNHILGINTDLNYKGLRLSILAEYRGGNVIYNAVGQSLDFTGISEHSALNGRQSFVIPGSVIETAPGVYATNTNIVVARAGRPFWNTSDYYNSDKAYVTSAAFWKLREVALTYEVPVQKLFGGHINTAQIGIVGRNLLMFRPKTNVWTDPEFNNSFVTSNAVGLTTEYQTPPTRVYGFSVKLSF